MQLKDYIRILTKRAWIIILVIVISTGSALLFSKLQTPVYRSTIYLNVWPARLDWGLQQTIQGLMRNYAGRISSRDTAFRVTNRLQLDITPETLQSKLTVDPVEEDFVIQIDADDYDPLIARDIAQTTGEIFVEDIKADMLDLDIRDRVTVTIRDYALPGLLHKPKWKINALAGGVLGLFTGVLVVLLLEWLESDVIRTAIDIERHVGIAALGIIPDLSTHTPKSGVRKR